jgi:heptaprenyl diphosphate synthase
MRPGSPRQLARLGLFTSAALALFVFEQLLPRPLPWMKPGLANLAVLLALWTQGPAAALAVQLVKWLVGSLLTGSLGGPAFVIAGTAGAGSWAAMALARRWAGRLFSPVGISLIGAAVHQALQLLTAGLYVRQLGLLALLPLSLLSALASGAFIGLLAAAFLEKARAAGWFSHLNG